MQEPGREVETCETGWEPDKVRQRHENGGGQEDENMGARGRSART